MRLLASALLLIIHHQALCPVFAACPHGKIHCPAPGECGRYVDENGDGICDESQASMKTGENMQYPASGGTRESLTEETFPAEDMRVQPPDDRRADTSNKRPSSRRIFVWTLTLAAIFIAVSETISLLAPGLKMLLRFLWNWVLFLSFTGILATSLILVFPSRFFSVGTVLYWHTVSGFVVIFAGMYHTAQRAKCMMTPVWKAGCLK